MSHNPGYATHRPRWYRPRMSTYWWLSRRSYFAFILRELTSVFVAWFVVYLLMLVYAVSQGATSYQQFLDWSARPFILFVNVVSFLFLLYHAITWFNLAPQAMVVKVGGFKVPGFLIAASNYAGWLFLSAVVYWFLVGA
jgi:fumarate reductase subunit C